MPTFLLMKEGAQVDKLVGANLDEIKKRVEGLTRVTPPRHQLAPPLLTGPIEAHVPPTVVLSPSIHTSKEKSDAYACFKTICQHIQIEKGYPITQVRNDHGREFENSNIEKYCDKKGIKHEFSAPRTPQQNGVVERKNRTLQEMERVMLHAKRIPRNLFPQVNDDDEGSWEIFEVESQSNGLDEGVSYEEIDIPTSADEKVENDSEVKVDEPLEDEELGQHNLVEVDIPTSADEKVENDSEVKVDEPLEDEELGQYNLVPVSTKEPSARVKLHHPISQVIGDPNDEKKTRRQIGNEINYVYFTSTLEPKKGRRGFRR
ncbi:hypothetical protein RHSIM_Rhsim02G0114700 [Rhododendron simsii]|uniref:Integrase catalytic domain-containing protein n=1 Tax=Rhododendron simsii TaxID=118357 RepID=A0A834HD65_RHOSS|nr:hypothetical protein RHSIM_Rhsim02G0114700 [Rhododendron simsii]